MAIRTNGVTEAGPTRRSRRTLAVCLALIALTALALFPAPSFGITRDVVISRARHWVFDLKAYYSQSQTDTLEGYRRDCSGFVSMAWRLTDASGAPLSMITSTLPRVSTQIPTATLQPGDMLLRQPGDSRGGHSVIFGGWADTKHTKYYCFEERNRATGATMTVVPFPYFNGGPGFRPYRYVGIEEDYLDYIEPIRGVDRYATAVAASRSSWATGTAATVVVATGADWPDALAGSALAGAVAGPILLVEPARLRTDVRAELVRLGAKTVYVLGGERSVAPTVAAAIDALPGVSVRRIAGSDRYATAASVAAAVVSELKAHSRTFGGDVYLATGQSFPDALAVSPIAARTGRPVLLASAAGLPEATKRALRSLGAKRVTGLGGERTLPPAVLAAADAEVPGSAARIAGKDRYATALAVAEHGRSLGIGWWRVGLATGETFPDGLTGGVMLSRAPSLLLLTPGARLDWRVAAALKANKAAIGKVRCVGGMTSLSPAVRKSVALALGM